jgi:CRISPR-associated endonuclease/helicase Cas3
MLQSNSPLQFWGKTKPNASGKGAPVSHLLVHHSLDVAAVAERLLSAFPHRLAFIAGLCRSGPEAAKALLIRLIALHDIGKFHPSFQAKQPELCMPELVREGASGGGRHGAIGYKMLESEEFDILSDFQPCLKDWYDGYFFELCAAVAFHHGSPSDCEPDFLKGFELVRPAVSAFREQLADLIPLEGCASGPANDKDSAILCWCVAGLTVLSDWIGSNSHHFDYPQRDMSLAAYWQHARAQAERAVAASGILPASPKSLKAANDLLASGHVASPLQDAVFGLRLGEGPQLFIIEDVTGAGKTEAALMLASRLLCAGRASGLYFALPTMATANAMYERMSASYRGLFHAAASPSLALAHGRKALHDGFSASILEIAEREAGPRTANPDDEAAEAMCAAWIADDRRKAFFAHVGAGTIDQALLGVLPSRHQALRLWGLADRVLIIDEAHSYDPYVNKELERLIEFHAALGGSAIILSATLASGDRQTLVDSFSRGLQSPNRTIKSADYPLLTAVSSAALTETPVKMRNGLPRSLPVRRLASIETAIDEVCIAAERNAAVAWIRNAVDDAIEACEMLEVRGLKPLLLHARFAMGDRLDKEREIQRALGRDSGGEQRQRVIVGTQILEQSLDYDVDAMVIDLAPVDLMIQRAGRLWRHRRDRRALASPELLIVSPDPDEPAIDKDWYAALSRRATGVYQDTGVVWRSAKALFDAGFIDTPGNIRELIARVYGEDSPLVTPDCFERAALDAEGKALGRRSVAAGNLLHLWKGYYGNNQIWMRDDKIPTRLEEQPSTVFRLGLLSDGKIVPWIMREADTRRAWALSEVSIASRHANGVPAPSNDVATLVNAAKAEWGKWEADIPLLILESVEGDAPGDIWQGRVTSANGERILLYDKRLGLRLAGD